LGVLAFTRRLLSGSAPRACALSATALACAACGSSGNGNPSATSTRAPTEGAHPSKGQGTSVISSVTIEPGDFVPAGVTEPTGGVSKGATVTITLTKAARVRLTTETAAGKEVTTAPALNARRGDVSIDFTGRDEGQPLPTGNYVLVATLASDPKLGPVRVDFGIL
jgi:FlgD Ig-like domain